MKRITIIVFSVLIIALSGCLKDKTNVDFTNVGALVEMPYSGVGSFSTDALNFSSDTITQTFTINLASPKPLKQDITVTVGIDTTLVPLRNAADTTIHYAVMPASAYSSFPDQTVTIKAGTRLDTFQVSFYNTTLDPTLSYMLPISIKSVSDKSVTISGNMGVHYFHAIGNPIAGTYEQQWIRYNTLDTSASGPGPVYNRDEGAATFSPVTPTTIRVASGTGVSYLLSFTNTGGVLNGFSVAFPTDASDAGSAAANGITITSGPVVEQADAVKGIYRFEFTYNNSAGSARTIIDQFVK